MKSFAKKNCRNEERMVNVINGLISILGALVIVPCKNIAIITG